MMSVIFGKMQGVEANNALLNCGPTIPRILQLAESCYWDDSVFSLAHEMAHAYFAHIGKKYSEKHLERKEYDADMVANDIVLRIIMDAVMEHILEDIYLSGAHDVIWISF